MGRSASGMWEMTGDLGKWTEVMMGSVPKGRVREVFTQWQGEYEQRKGKRVWIDWRLSKYSIDFFNAIRIEGVELGQPIVY